MYVPVLSDERLRAVTRLRNVVPPEFHRKTNFFQKKNSKKGTKNLFKWGYSGGWEVASVLRVVL